MREDVIQSGYQLIGYLLRYPSEEHYLVREEALQFATELKEKSVSQPLTKFLRQLQSMDQEQWVEHYIDIFDFGKTTNLYMTYLKLGEQKERGLELLKLKKFYEAAGFEVTDKELPDYLPVMLEFCGRVEKKVRIELLAKHLGAIAEIKSKLTAFNSSYHYLLESLVAFMKQEGIEVNESELAEKEKPLSLEDVRIMQSMREQLIQNQLS